MDRTAIDAIQELSGDAARQVQNSLPQHVVAVPAGINLSSLEKYLQGRSRYRGTMVTQSIPDFVSYVKAHAGGDGFIDAEDLEATVFFNLGTEAEPGHGDYTARLKLKATAEFQAMLQAGGKAYDQQAALDFIEDWSHLIGAAKLDDDGQVKDDIPLSRAIAAIRKVKIQATSSTETTQGTFHAAQSRIDSVEATSDAGLPDVLTFKALPYHGLRERTFLLRLSVSTSGPKPTLRFRVVGLDAVEEDIAREFKSLLLAEVGNAATMTIGTFTP